MPTLAPTKKKGKTRQQWLREVREALRPRERLTASQWADRYRVLGPENPEPGQWRTDRRPFLREVMDTFSSRGTQAVVTVFANQLGKTEILNNCLGWAADQAPGPMMLTFDSEDTSKRHALTRLHPMFRLSPQLNQHVIDLGLKLIQLRTCNIAMAWSGSSGSMSSTPCRYVFADEIDSWEAYTEDQRHGSPVAQVEVRVRAFGEIGKQYYSGTPTTEEAYLWPLFQGTDRRRYWVPCPHCDHYQILIHERLKWPKLSPAEILAGRLAWVECEKCQGKILDEHKAQMFRAGRWAPHGCRVVGGEVLGPRPPALRAGFQLSAFYSPQLSFSAMAAKFLEAIGDEGLMHDYYNLFLAEPYRKKVEAVAEKRVWSARRPYRRGTVPAGARKLTCGVDVQIDHFWFVVRAWGPKEKSWLVDCGRIESWQDLTRLARKRWEVDGGGARDLDLLLIDAGYEPAKVHDWMRTIGPRARATKGSDNPALRNNVAHSSPRPGWILWTFKANFFKDLASKHINSRPETDERGVETGEWWGEWCLPEDIDEEYVRQVTSERRVWVRKRGRRHITWEPKTQTTPNHLWDCEVLNELAAEMLFVRWIEAPAAGNVPQRAPEAPTASPPGELLAPREDWIQGDDWVQGGQQWLGPG